MVLRFVPEELVNRRFPLDFSCRDQNEADVPVSVKRVYLVFGLSDSSVSAQSQAARQEHVIRGSRNDNAGLLAVEWGGCFLGKL